MPTVFLRTASPWLFFFVIQGAGPARAEPPSDPLTLAQALALVAARSPQLASVAAEMEARNAHAVQAGVLRNPELRTDVENVGGSGTREGFEDTETTVRLSQLIELGGKRAKRRRVAELDRELAGWDYEGRKRELVSAATKAFIRALAAQDQLRLAGELGGLAERAVSAAEAQVRAGAAPPVETARARVALDRSRLERGRAERAFDAARRALAATWGSQHATFRRLAGTLAVPAAIPSLEALRAQLDASPDLARWTTELEERGATLALEESGTHPRRHSRGRGAALQRYRRSRRGVRAERSASALRPQSGRHCRGAPPPRPRRAPTATRPASTRTPRSRAPTTRWPAPTSRHIRLRDEVIPAAQRSTDGAVDAYRQGLFRFGDVLDAQRTLFELRGEYLKALETYQSRRPRSPD